MAESGKEAFEEEKIREPFYVLDGYGLIFRAYYAFIRAPMRSRKGMNTSAVFGFFRVLASFIKHYKPQYFAVALESLGPTFRDNLYPEYKATRQKTPEDLVEQFPWIERILTALGLPLLRVEGFEADDIMATVAALCKKEGRPCRIISADKDMLQLVDEDIQILRPSKDGGFELLGPEEVLELKGVRPDQILDFLSLLGDTADNVPGVKGIGEKTAIKLLHAYESLEGIYEHLDAIGGSSAKKLAEGKENAFFSRSLIELRQDVEIREFCGSSSQEKDSFYQWAPFRVTDFKGREAAKILRELDIGALAIELESWDEGSETQDSSPAALQDKKEPSLENDGTSSAVSKDPKETSESDQSIPIEQVGYDQSKQNFELVKDVEGLNRWVGKALKAGLVALDTETEGLDVFSDKLCGVSLCLTEGEAAYFALRGPEGLVMDEDQFRTALKPLVESRELKIIGQNYKFDYEVFIRFGLNPAPAYADTMIAAWLIDATSNRYNMDDLALQYLNYKTIHFEDLFDAQLLQSPPESDETDLFSADSEADVDSGLDKSDNDKKTGQAPRKTANKKAPLVFSRVPLDQAAVYAAEDAEVTFRLWKAMEGLLKEKKLEDLFYTLEMPLVGVLGRMELQGMSLDTKALESYSLELELRIRQVEEEVYRLVGHPFNLASTKQLQEVLFKERGLQGLKKTKTGYSTDTSVLEDLARQDVVPAKILEFRGMSKLKSTYVDTLPALVNSVSHRLHTNLTQNGTATGRMASRDPNLQNIPIKDEDGRRIRTAFICPQGSSFVSADYSQIELVVLAHFAKDPGLSKAFLEGTDVHRNTAALIFGVSEDEVNPEQRRAAKTINFGVMYGMSAFRLAGELGISRQDAQAFIDAYFATYSGIRAFMEQVVAEAESTGGVRTLWGRFRSIPDIYSRNKNLRQAAERVAVNTPIQGSAADIVKAAMLKVDQALKKAKLKAALVLQVHDELIIECPDAEIPEVEALLEREMTQVAALSVPLKVSVEHGKTWGSMH